MASSQEMCGKVSFVPDAKIFRDYFSIWHQLPSSTEVIETRVPMKNFLDSDTDLF